MNRENYYMIGGILFFCLVLLFFRSPLPPGGVPYYHLQMVEHLTTPFHIILSGLLGIFSVFTVAFYFPLVLFLGSAVLFLQLLKEGRLRMFTCILLLLSPLSLFTSMTLHETSFSIFLLLLGLVLRHSWVRFVFFLLALWQHIFNAVFIFPILSWPMRILFGGFIFFVHSFRFEPLPDVGLIFTDMGAPVGIGIFTAVLLVLGLLELWTKKYQHVYHYLCFVFGLVCWFFLGNSVAFYLNFYFAYLSALGFLAVFDHRWESKIVKKLTLLVLACGLLFSFLSYTNRMSQELPSLSFAEGAEWLRDNTPPGSIILTSPSRGFWLEYFGQRPAFATPLHPREGEVNSIFYAVTIDHAVELLKTNNIKYIWIDHDMKKQIWSKEEGLLFFFKNKERFKRIYSEKGVEIWKVM